MHALTAYELRDCGSQLESAMAFFGRKDPVPPANVIGKLGWTP
jgi:hypothetical protein